MPLVDAAAGACLGAPGGAGGAVTRVGVTKTCLRPVAADWPESAGVVTATGATVCVDEPFCGGWGGAERDGDAAPPPVAGCTAAGDTSDGDVR